MSVNQTEKKSTIIKLNFMGLLMKIYWTKKENVSCMLKIIHKFLFNTLKILNFWMVLNLTAVLECQLIHLTGQIKHYNAVINWNIMKISRVLKLLLVYV